MRVQAKIQKWGNSLALRLSGPLKDIPKFKAEMLVDINVNEEGITVKPAAINKNKIRLPFSETELLNGLTSQKAHSDELLTPTLKELGKE